MYDGVNSVQEIAGGSPTANILTGGVDELFLRSDISGNWNFLADGIGSISALTDSTGTIQTQYTYEPFGSTSQTGTMANNGSQYTGRENDGTGLYYYRARYYSPSLQRFISEDPVMSSTNLYSYAADGPVNLVDPTGLTTWPTNYPGPAAVTSPYGAARGQNGLHNGVDLHNPMDSPAYASDGGTVVNVFYNDRGGNQIIIQLPDGSRIGYAHTDPVDGLEPGVEVNEGDIIGYSDASGNDNGAPVRPHLHYTFRKCPTCPTSDPLDHLYPDPDPNSNNGGSASPSPNANNSSAAAGSDRSPMVGRKR